VQATPRNDLGDNEERISARLKKTRSRLDRRFFMAISSIRELFHQAVDTQPPCSGKARWIEDGIIARIALN